ncbi:MAG: hypothetical protein AAB345_00110 [Patescibacteria group bacterium]
MGDESSTSEVSKAELGKDSDRKKLDFTSVVPFIFTFVILGLLGGLIAFGVSETRGEVRAAEVAFKGPELTLAELVQYQGCEIDKDFAFVELHNCVLKLTDGPNENLGVFVRVSKDVWALCRSRHRLDVVGIEGDLKGGEKYREALERIRRGEPREESPATAEKK